MPHPLHSTCLTRRAKTSLLLACIAAVSLSGVRIAQAQYTHFFSPTTGSYSQSDSGVWEDGVGDSVSYPRTAADFVQMNRDGYDSSAASVRFRGSVTLGGFNVNSQGANIIFDHSLNLGSGAAFSSSIAAGRTVTMNGGLQAINRTDPAQRAALRNDGSLNVSGSMWYVNVTNSGTIQVNARTSFDAGEVNNTGGVIRSSGSGGVTFFDRLSGGSVINSGGGVAFDGGRSYVQDVQVSGQATLKARYSSSSGSYVGATVEDSSFDGQGGIGLSFSGSGNTLRGNIDVQGNITTGIISQAVDSELVLDGATLTGFGSTFLTNGNGIIKGNGTIERNGFISNGRLSATTGDLRLAGDSILLSSMQVSSTGTNEVVVSNGFTDMSRSTLVAGSTMRVAGSGILELGRSTIDGTLTNAGNYSSGNLALDGGSFDTINGAGTIVNQDGSVMRVQARSGQSLTVAVNKIVNSGVINVYAPESSAGTMNTQVIFNGNEIDNTGSGFFGGQIRNTDRSTIVFDTNLVGGSVFADSGYVFFDGGTVDGTTLYSDGNVYELLDRGYLEVRGDTTFRNVTLDERAVLRVAEGATLSLEGQFINNGRLIGNVTLAAEQLLTGGGSIDQFVNSGIVNAGASPGSLEFGTFADNGGNLVVELAGFADSQFDIYSFTESADLGGTLSVVFLDGFTASLGDRWEFFRYSGTGIADLTGEFDWIDFSQAQLANGLSWQLDYDYDNGSVYLFVGEGGGDGVNPVPEPATIAVWSLIGLCGVAFGIRQRRREVERDRR